MKQLIKTIAAFCLLLVMGNAYADVKVAYVQADRVLQNAPQTSEVGKKLDKEFSTRNAELQILQKQVQEQQALLDSDDFRLSESDRNKKNRDLADLKIEFEHKKREFDEDINIRKNEELATLQQRINKAINSVAESAGYDMVVFSGVAYASKQTDITDAVLKALETK